LVKKIEDLNEFWAVLKTQNRFMQGIECTPPFFLDIKNNRRLDKPVTWTVALAETKARISS
jgi:hypothetical protein